MDSGSRRDLRAAIRISGPRAGHGAHATAHSPVHRTRLRFRKICFFGGGSEGTPRGMSEALLDASQTTTATLPRGSQVRSASRGSRRNTGARARGFGPATPTRKRRQLPNRQSPPPNRPKSYHIKCSGKSLVASLRCVAICACFRAMESFLSSGSSGAEACTKNVRPKLYMEYVHAQGAVCICSRCYDGRGSQR